VDRYYEAKDAVTCFTAAYSQYSCRGTTAIEKIPTPDTLTLADWQEQLQLFHVTNKMEIKNPRLIRHHLIMRTKKLQKWSKSDPIPKPGIPYLLGSHPISFLTGEDHDKNFPFPPMGAGDE